VISFENPKTLLIKKASGRRGTRISKGISYEAKSYKEQEVLEIQISFKELFGECLLIAVFKDISNEYNLKEKLGCQIEDNEFQRAIQMAQLS